ncbi:MAG: hypothetical protein HN368_19190 [Spirochaetales bacterium]|jgi:hypothetical protein|nr:hypothetical protein [Spirochaetales bacterium]
MAVKAENVASKITLGINGNHLIHDASHLSVEAKTKGFLFWKTTEIKLAGRVDTAIEKAEIDKIVETEKNGFAIINTIRVDRRN